MIDSLKDHIKPEAGPGVPCSRIAARNDLFLTAMGERFNDIVLDRIERLLAIGQDDIDKMHVKERIDRNLMDPVRVFVKNEPHKIEKLESGRVRLINSVSLVDKMIEMLLCRHLYKLEIANWDRIPSKPGIGFTPESAALVYQDIMDHPFTMAVSDMSGWDWGVKPWQIRDEAECVIKLCDNPSDIWEHLVRVKAQLECWTVYQFSDGTLVTTNYQGNLLSGLQKTSRSNSFMRNRLASIIGSKKAITAGDDCIEEFIETAQQQYADYGFRLKGYEKVVDAFEFCSHLYSKNGVYSLNYEKMLMNLLHQEPSNFLEYKQLILGFEDELSAHPSYNSLIKLLEEVGFTEVEGPHYEVNNNE